MIPSTQAGDSVALVTGGGARIGHWIARDLAEQAYKVAIHYNRSAEDAEQTVQQIQRDGGTAAAFQADLTDESQIVRLFQKIVDQWQRLDVLVNTASIWSPQKFEQIRAADLLENFRVNTLATFLCAQQAARIMVDQQTGGAIVNFGDAAVDQPPQGYAAYFVSKGAIPAMTRSLAVELAARNPRVRVNCLQPGSIMSPDDANADERERRRKATLVQLADLPQTACHAVRFLIENPFLTGASLTLDGGRNIVAHRL